MALRVMHIAEVGLRVKDLARMVAFYHEVLGLEIVRAYPHHVFLKAGELPSQTVSWRVRLRCGTTRSGP